MGIIEYEEKARPFQFQVVLPIGSLYLPVAEQVSGDRLAIKNAERQITGQLIGGQSKCT